MSRPNVFLVTADGLRYDRLSLARDDAETTPRLDELAADGAVCHDTVATGTGTRTSFPGILTSSYPLMYGGFAQMTEHRVPVSSFFQSQGYVTLGVNTNAQLHTRFGWDRGYDVYYDSESTTVNDPVGEFEPADASDGAENGSGASAVTRGLDRLKDETYSRLDHDGLAFQAVERVYRLVTGRTPPHDRAASAVDRALSFVDAAPDDDPVFLWVHFMETHSPYVPPAPYRDLFLEGEYTEGELWRLNDRLHTEPDGLSDDEVAVVSDLYDASLRYLDDEIGRLFDGLGERGRFDDAVVGFTSDHGEQFREHGKLTHCAEPYEEGVHVPLILRAGGEKLTDVDGSVTSTIDVAPTLIDFALGDVEMPERYHGRSLGPVLRGEETIPADRAVFSQDASEEGREINLDNRITGCRTREWKYITSVKPAVPDKLFHLPSDPGEQRTVADENPDVVAEFERIVESHYDQNAYTEFSIADAVGTGHVSERLQALGYLDE